MLAALAALVTALTLLPEALALPRLGERVPDALLSDPEGKALDTRALRGKSALLLYEDEGSLAQNAPLKDALADLARDARYRAAIALAPVADLSEYAGWPLRGAAEDAIRARSREAGVSIYCDWDGSFRRAYRLHQGLSNVVLLGPDGRVLFAAAGPLRPEQRSRLLALLARQLPAS
jgi:hypothetical protein